MIRPERPADRDAIRAVHLASFPTAAEANLVDELRDCNLHIASLVFEREGHIVGHVLFSELDSMLRTAALGPVGVLPEHRRQGIAHSLIETGIGFCRRAGAQVICVLGNPAYYKRFGFSSELGRCFDSPYAAAGDAWMALVVDPVPIDYPAPWTHI